MKQHEKNGFEELENIFDAAPCGVGILSVDDRRPMYFNRAYYRLFGYTPQEYGEQIGDDFQKLLVPRDQPVYEHIADYLAAAGDESATDYGIVRKDGGVRRVRFSHTEIAWDGERCALCFFEDVTTEKDSLEQLGLVAENIGSSISVLLMKGEKVELLYANDTFFKWVGAEREHYGEDTLEYNMSFVAEGDRPATLAAVYQSARTGEPQDLEYRFLRPDEPPRWLNRRLAAIKRDEQGAFLVASIVTDVTERKNVEMERAAERERTRSVMDNMPCGLVKVVMERDGSTRPVLVNKTFLTITDMSLDEMMKLYGNDSCAGIHPDDLDGVRELMQGFRPGENRSAVFRLKKGKCGWVWVRVTAFIKEEDGALMLYNSYLDISNELESELVRDSLLNMLPGGVAVIRFADTIECLYFNDGFAALSDRSRQELEKAIHSDGDLEKLIYPTDMAYVLGEVEARKVADEPINTTFRFFAKGGEVKWIHLTASKLREDGGFPVYYCVFAEPSKQAMLYRSIADGASMGIMVADLETHEIYYLNQAFRKLMQLSYEQPYVGRKCYDFVLHKSRPCEDCVIGEKKLGTTCEVIRHYSKPGIDVKVRSAIINWLGRTALVEYAVDVTAEYQKRLAQEELLNRVPAGIGIYELSGGDLHQVYMNDGYFRLIKADRATREKRQKEGFLSLIHPEDVHIITDAAKAVRDGQDTFSLLHRVLCGDGVYRWFRLDGTVTSREAGKTVAYCAYTDYDEIEQSRIRLEKAHAALKNKYAQELAQRKALEKESAVIVAFNITQDRLISCQALDDRFFTHAAGLSGAELMSDLLKRVPCTEDLRKSALFFDPQRAKTALHKGVPMNSEEYRCRQKDGLLHWIKAISNVETDPETSDLISYTYLKDIDKERKCAVATNSVIDEETDYVLLVSAIADVCTIVWVREHYMEGGAAIRPLQDLAFSSSAQYVRLDTVVSEDRASIELLMDKSALMRELETTSVRTITYRRTEQDGKLHRKKVRAFYLDETKEDVIIAQRDITDLYEEEQEQKRRLEAASRAKSDFLARISHDMRTPLNGILGTVYLAREKDDPAELKKDMETIESAGELLLNLVNDTLDMSRIESGRIELHPEICDEKKLFDAIFAAIRPSLDQKNIRLHTTFIGIDWKQMMLDVPRLQQVFLNLFSNAIKFTPEGGSIDWVMECLEETDDHVIDRFIVRDTGCGMSEAFQKHMFEPFAQENRVNTDQTMGTGLGLSIVKRIVELMDGTITVKSKVGKGTEFCIILRLPVRCSLRELEKEPEQKEISFRGARILLCEDNRLNTIIATKLLEKVGCIVETAENGKLGAEMFAASSPGYYAAVLMDIRMPEMDGLEAARAIRSPDRSDAKTIPIIAMSANAFAEDRQESLAAGMNAHLSKPIEPQKLYETLEREIAAGKDER